MSEILIRIKTISDLYGEYDVKIVQEQVTFQQLVRENEHLLESYGYIKKTSKKEEIERLECFAGEIYKLLTGKEIVHSNSTVDWDEQLMPTTEQAQQTLDLKIGDEEIKRIKCPKCGNLVVRTNMYCCTRCTHCGWDIYA